MKSHNTTTTAPAPKVNRRRGAVILAGLAALTLAGCKHDEEGTRVAGWALVDPAQRHPIIVSQEPQVMSLRVARGSNGLSPQQRAELLAFADRSRASDAGNSRLVISAPSGSSNEVAAMHAVQDIRRLLSDRGFPESSIAVEAYSEDGGKGGDLPVKVSYLRYIATGPECGDWHRNLAFEPQNFVAPNMGCANQRNLAAMVANPADLLGPRTQGDHSSERRDVVWDKYIKGESSNTQKNEDEKINTQDSKN